MTSGPRRFSETVRTLTKQPIICGRFLQMKRGKLRFRLSDEVWRDGKHYVRRKTWENIPAAEIADAIDFYPRQDDWK